MIIIATPFRPAHFQSMMERSNIAVPKPVRTMVAEIKADPTAYIIEGDYRDVTPTRRS
jgi:hypothetical protein